MKLRLISLAMIAALLSVFVMAPMSADAKPRTGTGTATLTGVDATGATITGTVSDLSASTVGGVTQITGTFTQAGTAGAVDPEFIATVVGGSGTCQILHLELGPLDLDLLGLVVHLDQVVLDITAQSGAGNLLGNLLCAVAGLLDGNRLGTLLTNLLNQIFAILNNL